MPCCLRPHCSFSRSWEATLRIRQDLSSLNRDSYICGIPSSPSSALTRHSSALTASCTDSERQHADEVGMDNFLSKPFSAKQLEDVVVFGSSNTHLNIRHSGSFSVLAQ